MDTVSVLTEILVDFLLGCFSLAMIAWTVVGVQTVISDYRREKRDSEYHDKRMKTQ